MTRIVAGSARGRALRVPDRGTRPTSDRAREALFNTVSSHLDLVGARVLDLFAGSGAVGLEALSREAASAVLVEHNRGACAVIRSNVQALGLVGATVVAQSAQSYLQTCPADSVDLIFADPPYAMQPADLAAMIEGAVAVLAPAGLIVVERSARTSDVQWPCGVAALKNRRYGESMLWYGRRVLGPA